MSIRRCSYRRYPGSVAASDKGARKPVAVPLPDAFQDALNLAFEFFRFFAGDASGASREGIAGEFLQTALIDWFESTTGKRIGEYAAALAAGRRFEWRRRHGRVYLADVSEGLRVQ